MSSDYHLDLSAQFYENWKNKKIREFQRNGADWSSAVQLVHDIENDPLQLAGLDAFLDRTLELRVEQFSSKSRGRKKTNQTNA